jgi:hypothetical protein
VADVNSADQVRVGYLLGSTDRSQSSRLPTEGRKPKKLVACDSQAFSSPS